MAKEKSCFGCGGRFGGRNSAGPSRRFGDRLFCHDCFISECKRAVMDDIELEEGGLMRAGLTADDEKDIKAQIKSLDPSYQLERIKKAQVSGNGPASLRYVQ